MRHSQHNLTNIKLSHSDMHLNPSWSSSCFSICVGCISDVLHTGNTETLSRPRTTVMCYFDMFGGWQTHTHTYTAAILSAWVIGHVSKAGNVNTWKSLTVLWCMPCLKVYRLYAGMNTRPEHKFEVWSWEINVFVMSLKRFDDTNDFTDNKPW